MKDGSRLRLNSLTFSQNVKIEVRDRNVTPITQLWAFVRRQRIPAMYETVRNERWGQAQPAVWLEIERRKGARFRPRRLRAEIHMPNGQILGTAFGGGSWFAAGQDIYQAMMPALPTTIEELDLRIVADDETFQFRVENPAYRRAVTPVFTQTLPVTEARGDLVASMEGFTVKPMSASSRKEQGFNLWVTPKFQLWWKGSPADEWFDKGIAFSNGSGTFNPQGWVFGEPYWKVRITIKRNAKFPRSEEEPIETSIPTGKIEQQTETFEYTFAPPSLPAMK